MKVLNDGTVIRQEKKDRSKCRKWLLRVKTDEGPKSKRVNGTYTQANQELERFKAYLATPRSDDTFADCTRIWMERREKSGKIVPETIQKDKSQVKKLVDKFGARKVDTLTYTDMVDGLLAIKEERHLSNTSMAPLYTKARSILNEARKDGKISKNPMADVETPAPDKSKRKPLTVEQFETFIADLLNMPLDAHTMALRFYLLGGMRRGEPLALTWEDVDNALIRVHQSYSGIGRLKDTKTGNTRTIPMVAILARDLAEWRTVQQRELYRLGITQTSSTPVITSATGTRMHPDNVDRWWRHNRDKFGLPGVVLHELRHTFATLVSTDLNTPLQAVCDLAGWTDLATANIYVHGRDDANRAAIHRFSDFVDNAAGVTSVTQIVTREAEYNAS